jgi:hypothetical protein
MAGFFGSSTGGVARGLGAGFELALGFAFRDAGAAGGFFTAAETIGAGGLTGAGLGDELVAATTTSGCLIGLATSGSGAVGVEAAGSEEVELPPSMLEIALPG